MASSRIPSEETSDPEEDQPVWHPAHEQLDETDSTDPDYQPSPSEGQRRLGVLDEWGGIERYEDPSGDLEEDEEEEDDDDDYLGAERFVIRDTNDPTCTSMFICPFLHFCIRDSG